MKTHICLIQEIFQNESEIYFKFSADKTDYWQNFKY